MYYCMPTKSLMTTTWLQEHSSAFGVSFNNGTTTARIHYDENHAPNKSLSLPYLPYYNDKEAAFDYYVSIKGLTETYPYQVPTNHS